MEQLLDAILMRDRRRTRLEFGARAKPEPLRTELGWHERRGAHRASGVLARGRIAKLR